MSMNKELLDKIYFRTLTDLYKKGDSIYLKLENHIDCYKKSSRPEKMKAFLETVRKKAIHNPHFTSFKATFVCWNWDDLNYHLYLDQEIHITGKGQQLRYWGKKAQQLRYWEKDYIPHVQMNELLVGDLNIHWWILNVHE